MAQDLSTRVLSPVDLSSCFHTRACACIDIPIRTARGGVLSTRPRLGWVRLRLDLSASAVTLRRLVGTINLRLLRRQSAVLMARARTRYHLNTSSCARLSWSCCVLRKLSPRKASSNRTFVVLLGSRALSNSSSISSTTTRVL